MVAVPALAAVWRGCHASIQMERPGERRSHSRCSPACKIHCWRFVRIFRASWRCGRGDQSRCGSSPINAGGTERTIHRWQQTAAHPNLVQEYLYLWKAKGNSSRCGLIRRAASLSASHGLPNSALLSGIWKRSAPWRRCIPKGRRVAPEISPDIVPRVLISSDDFRMTNTGVTRAPRAAAWGLRFSLGGRPVNAGAGESGAKKAGPEAGRGAAR